MIISIASGKGGTGKTTVATNLAFSIGTDVNLLDCDVEEPNAHIFLDPEISHRKTAYLPVPEIDTNRCTFCRQCAEICRFNAITVLGETVLTFPELCHSCGGCMLVCPENAITEKGRELGEVETGHLNGVRFTHGRLKVGEAMSPPLIKKVRAFLQPSLINIIDAPPGTSCPMVTTVKDSDFVLLVTEPTPFGLHDLILAVEVVKKLGIACGLVINRSDIGNDDVVAYAEKENIPILLNIPFERRFAELYSTGKLIAENFPDWKLRFQELFLKIQLIVKDNTL